MAAQIPPLFRNGPLLSTKQISVYQTRLILQVVLSMSALCLLELDLSSAQAQPDSPSSTASEPATGPQDSASPAAKPESSPISELELIKEEESVSIAIGLGREQPISEAPSNVYIISDEDIRHSGATDLPTILRRIPGMEVMQVTGAEFNVSVRGDNQLLANKLLVMIDGRSVYEDAYGSVFWTTFPVTLPEIKRIEVLKGPASALYGFNAFDGVINIITKSPAEIKGTTLQVGAGELGTLRAAAIQAGTYDKFGYRLSIGRDQNQQWRNRDALSLRQNKVNVHTDYALSSSSKVILQGGFVGNNRYDGQVFETIRETSTDIQSGFMHATYQQTNFFIRAWWNYWRHDAFETTLPSISKFFQILDRNGNTFQGRDRNTYNIEAQHALEFGPHRITYGANLRRNDFATNFVIGNSVTEDRLGFYVQEEWRATSHITATAGIRYDLNSEINPTFSPRVALLYQLNPNHSFRVAGSVAYRPPNLYESFIDSRGAIFPLGCPPACTAPVIRTQLLGSRNLAPEQIISYEMGYQGWYFKHRLRTRIDLFYNQISDLVSLRIPSSTNQGKADIYGGEAGIEFLATSWLTGFANYSYQEIGQSATGTAQRGAPRFKTNAGVRGEWDSGISGEATINYVSSASYPLTAFFLTASNFVGGTPGPASRVGGYVLVNLRGAYRFWTDKNAGREAEVALTVFNALNDKHQEHPLGDVLGSRVLGWLTISY